MFEYTQKETVSAKTAENLVDAEWFDRFEDVGNFQAYEYLAGDGVVRSEQRQKFFAGEIECPTLGYPLLEGFDFNGREQGLIDLKLDVSEYESNDVVRKAYVWRINEKIAELRMLKAARDGDDRRFSRYTRFVYGEPSPDIFVYTLQDLKRRIETENFEDDDSRAVLAKELMQELHLDVVKETNIPTLKVDPLIERGKDKDQLDAYALRDMFEHALFVRGMDQDWAVHIRPAAQSHAISVNQETKTLYIPSNRKMSKVEAHALIAHEIDTHIKRRFTGASSSLKLLSLGLDRYEHGEEGVATMKEQRIIGSADKWDNAYAGFVGHLAISLALGMDGTKRNFRAVFEILEKYQRVMGEDPNSARSKAWNTCVRVFRGTTTRTPGTCFTKDIVYREGNINTWQLVREDADEVRRFSVGKYDPANNRHVWILDQLGISNDTLDELKS